MKHAGIVYSRKKRPNALKDLEALKAMRNVRT